MFVGAGFVVGDGSDLRLRHHGTTLSVHRHRSCRNDGCVLFAIHCLKCKGIRFIVLYPPKCSHNLPPLVGTVHTETISIPQGIFQSSWQHIVHKL